VKGVEQSEKLQALYDQMWTQWIYLVLATLLPALKLIFGLGGVRWTSIWGAMFLLSIFTTEALILFGGRQLIRMASQSDNTEESERLPRHLRRAEDSCRPAEPLTLTTLYIYPHDLSKKLDAVH
jgi:hypothetical protein